MAKNEKPPIPADVKKLIDEQIAEGQKEADETTDVVEVQNSDALLQTPPEELEENDSQDDDSGLNEALYTGAGFKSGTVVNVSIVDAMKKDYIDYAMSVIVARALPDVKDGLKPSQRRILVAMRDLLLWPTASFRKSAKIAGQTTGDYHPHGEAVVYPTLVKLAQDFSMRYQLVHGQGNFGSIDGDPPAQMRYTEAKFAKITVELIKDIEKGTVLFRPNYDGTRNEPITLPAAFPNLLVNGSEGIAVGMATKIPPHNLGEIIDALVKMIDSESTWGGISLYNTLRQIRESKNRIPALLNSEPFEYWENYIAANDVAYRGRVAAFKEITKGGQIKPEHEMILEQDANTLREFLESERKVKGEAAPTSLYPRFVSRVTTQDLMEHVKGPDFPTGGQIYNQKEILSFYETGRGKIKTRGVIQIEEDDKGRQALIITELPYQVNKALLIQNIADLVQNDKIEGIRYLRDESAKNEIRVVIELKTGTTPQVVISKLYKYTALQMNFNANTIALVEDEPKTLNLKRILELYLDHRMTVTIRKLEFELAQNKYQAHILEGLLKALDYIDEVIKTIRASKTQDEARINLIARFDLTEVQAQAILDMQLRKLAALERQKIQDDYDGIMDLIKHHETYLSSENNILSIIRDELIDIKARFGDKRRTKVFKGEVDEPQEEDLVARAQTFVTISKAGYIKRIDPEEYRTQNRGGKGSIGAKLKENDYVNHTLVCSTHDWIMFFSNDGKVFKVRGYEIPEYKKTAKGLPIVNLIAVTQNTEISAVLRISDSEKEAQFIVMGTAKGIVKKTLLSEFDNIRKNGLTAIALKAGDSLISARLTTGKDNIIVVTQKGKSIKFDENDVKSSGRNTMGVKGITVKGTDRVIEMEVVENDKDVLMTISEAGYGKCTALSKFKLQKRGGQGIFAAKVGTKTGPIVVAKIFKEEDRKNETEFIVVSKQGIVIKTTLKSVPVLGRQTSGVRIIKVGDKDQVTGMAS
jgi:DNA gyrase subunit A